MASLQSANIDIIEAMLGRGMESSNVLRSSYLSSFDPPLCIYSVGVGPKHLINKAALLVEEGGTTLGVISHPWSVVSCSGHCA